jgi:hypothetical protein
MLRKMLLTGILVYVRPSSARPVVASIICLLSSCLLNYYQPYKNRILLWMAQGSFLLTALKYLLTVLGVLLDLSPENKTLMGGVLIFFDCLVIVSGLLCTVAIFVVLKSSAEKVKEIQNNTKQNHVVVPTNTMQSAAKISRSRTHLSLAHLQKALAQRAVGKVEEQAETALKHFKKVQEEKEREAHERTNKRLVKRRLSHANTQNTRGGIVVGSGGGEKVVSGVLRTAKPGKVVNAPVRAKVAATANATANAKIQSRFPRLATAPVEVVSLQDGKPNSSSAATTQKPLALDKKK